MRAALALCLLPVLLLGCGPCAGVSGACVALTLGWDGPAPAPEVDQLLVTLLDQRHESAAAPRTPPLLLTLIFPTPGPGARLREDDYALSVVASRMGRPVGSAEGAVALSPNRHTSLSLDLRPPAPTPPPPDGGDGGADGPLVPLRLRQVAQAAQPLAAVAFGGTSQSLEIYAVGDGGAVLRGTGTLASGGTWRAEAAGAQPLVAVAAAGDRWVALGAAGLYTRRVGAAAWDLDPALPPGGTLRGAWAAAPDDLYLVGDGGRVLHRQASYTTLPVPAGTGDLRAVWGAGPGEVYAVGDGGVILRRFASGPLVREAEGLTTQALRAVFGGPGEVYALGDGGVILQRLGGVWAVGQRGGPELRCGCVRGGQTFILGEGVLLRGQGGALVAAPGPAGPRGAACFDAPSGPGLAAVLVGGEVLLGD